MKKSVFNFSLSLASFLAFLSTGCGENLSQAELLATTQMEREPCLATFTQDYEVIDFWGDSLFTAKSGDSFILASLSEWGDELDAELYYLDEDGAYRFDVEVEGTDISLLPFELSCTGSRVSLLGAFTDVVVYADEELSEEVCSLSKGASAPIDSGTGHSLVSGIFEEPAVYQVELAGFSSSCGGLTQGYVEAPSASILGTNTVLVPLLRYSVAGS